MSAPRAEIPQRGTDWTTLREQLVAKGSRDVDWRRGRAAVYVFHAGEDVLRVARDAYALFQSENALGPLAFPSLKRMEARGRRDRARAAARAGRRLRRHHLGRHREHLPRGEDLPRRRPRGRQRRRRAGAAALGASRLRQGGALPRTALRARAGGRGPARRRPRDGARRERAHADAGRLRALLPVRRDRPDRGSSRRWRKSAGCGCTSTPASAAGSRRSRA